MFTRLLRRYLWRFAPTALLPGIRRGGTFQMPRSPVYLLWGATVASASIGLLAALFQVQRVKFPTPLFLTLAAVLLAIVASGVCLMAFEVWRIARAYLEHRATSVAWLEEPPGFLDYIPDGVTASERFNEELLKLAANTEVLGEELGWHAERFERLAKVGDPFAQQREANRSAKVIEQNARYIEKRLELLRACVKDIDRNFGPWIASQHITSDEQFEAAKAGRDSIEGARRATAENLQVTAEYRDTINGLKAQNSARTVRIASDRLGKALAGTVVVLRSFEKSAGNQVRELDKKLAEWSASQ